jgi:hypothetical protein
MESIADSIYLVLAQVHPMSAAESPITARMPTFDPAALALGAGAMAMILLTAMLVSVLLSASARREANHPRRLLAELCEAHGVRHRQKRALIAAANTLGVQQPARFFLERRLLEKAAGHPELSARRADLLLIASQLFGSTETV